MSEPIAWGTAWDRDVLIAQGVGLADLGFGIVRVYHPLSPTRCSCKDGEACGRNTGKHPIGDDWQKRAVHDPDRARTMLANPGNRSYGIIPPPGVFEWDVDKDAPARLVELTATLGALPPTRVHRSGVGKHVFYRWPESVPRHGGSVFGLTTRWAPGGMVVGPGSIHAATGRVYQVEADGPIATFPDAWARAAGAWSDDLHGRQDDAEPGDPDWIVPENHRHDFLVRRAARWRGDGLHGDVLRDALRQINAERCAAGGKPTTEIDELAAYYDRKATRGPDIWFTTSQPNYSGEPPVPSPGIAILPFLTARELSSRTTAEVAWRARPWLADGAITEIDGKPKAAGKSTFTAYLIRAILEGDPFLGEPTRRSPVVLLTEQPMASLRVTLGNAGVLERDDLVLLLWTDAAGVPWPSVVDQAAAKCAEIGGSVLVVDTLSQFAGLKGDAENSAGAANEVIAPLQLAAAGGLAVLINRHDRKSGGDVGESARGSSAFTGAVDVVIALRRGDGRPTARYLTSLSRFSETPAEVVIDLTPNGYVLLGGAGYARTEQRQGVLEVLSSDPQTAAAIASAAGIPERDTREALAGLTDSGMAERSGGGKRGDPFRWQRFIPGSYGEDLPRNRNLRPIEDLTEAARTVFGDMLA